MTTRNPIEPDPNSTQPVVRPIVDDSEILKNVEVPFDTIPDSVTQVNAVVTHTESGRCVRRMVVRDDDAEEVRDTEVGLFDSEEVYRIDRGWAEYTDEPRMVYVPALDDAMDIRRFARLVGFDQPGRKLGCQFEEAYRDANGTPIL